MLEKIQHWATKLVSYLSNLPYKEWIKILDLYTLEKFGRRKNWQIVSHLPLPIFTDTLKLYLEYALNLAYSAYFPH